MCLLSLMDVYLISYQYDMDLIWMELRITSHSTIGKLPPSWRAAVGSALQAVSKCPHAARLAFLQFAN